MAATKKKSAGKRRTPAGRKKKQVQTGPSMESEIFLWIVLAVSVVLLISNFGVGGSVGNAISSFFFGLVGLVCYPLPIFLFLGVAFVIANKRNPRAYRKMAGFVLLFLAVCLFLQLVTEGAVYERDFMAYYRVSAEYKTGGGLLGGALSRLLVQAFGTVGTYVITVIAMVISFVLITQKSMFDMIKKFSRKMYRRAAERKAQRQEELKARQEEQAEKEQQQERRKKRKERTEDFLKETEVNEPEQERKRKKESKASRKKAKEQEVSGDILLDEPFVPENAFPIHRAEELVQDLEEIVPPPEEEKETSKKNPRSSKAEIEQGIHEVSEEIALKEAEVKKAYEFPPMELLKKGKQTGGDSDAHLRETAGKLQETLHNFGVNVSITNVSCGPTVTRYELQPEQGVKVSKIVGLTDDIKLNLAATDIRIEAPIPGKAAVGIEVPNENNSTVMLRDLLQSEAFSSCKSKLAFAAGKDIAGKPVITDIAKMPHLLIAGATGSGKSVCINTIIISLLYKASPDDVKLIMIDPKVVELSVYNGIPHLFIPVVTDPKKAAGALNWAVAEMTDRYNKFAQYNVRDLKGYNAKVESISNIEDENKPKKLPQIVIIVDELADLMMVAPGEVEDSICRLAQLARAAGIHLIIATQRPSVNVITGLIKANMPSRIAFSVSSGVDSRTILDMNGAEKLLGKGDMLFYPQGYQKPARVQGAFVSDQEVGAVVDFLSKQNPTAEYDKEIQEKIEAVKETTTAGADTANDRDVYFADAGKFIIEKDKASIGMLQRVFKIGFNRAARIMDQLYEAGVVGDEEGTKPRKVLMSMEEFEQYIDEYL
ncbi:FtsK/SpoIIIE family DNA translocase [Blautia hansenii]|uniref:FtsK/SpoIIIE family protein n=1 Tax=Blautia hansenii DSM 20583 TaxID=537007 RepID=C9L5P1_BLAHA|nr:DNA translocase FtsK 4TM domain-containing protein [Blautia hansenii]ASM69386.1 DNA translocase FtsK [Blautia hansenii DSM 20583]EEX22473.1 FtsK/SpoIIIE family protein [Blautia hansenii DSM 20583]UWO11973.1 DNA translocase FtsK [Blautia hansenii DSM 20583]